MKKSNPIYQLSVKKIPAKDKRKIVLARHKHTWYKIGKEDETGCIVSCQCGLLVFLSPQEIKKFNELRKNRMRVDIEIESIKTIL